MALTQDEVTTLKNARRSGKKALVGKRPADLPRTFGIGSRKGRAIGKKPRQSTRAAKVSYPKMGGY